jgi:hypothetical protein
MESEVVYGWKGVAAAIGIGMRTAQDYALRADDPLPVSMRAGRVQGNVGELADWWARQLRPYRTLRSA